MQQLLYRDGTPSGELKTYYPNGTLKEHFSVVKGKKEGPYTMYHENGAVKVKAVYSADLLEGEVEGWFEDGLRSCLHRHEQGKLVGAQFDFFPAYMQGEATDEVVQSSSHFDTNGLRDGEQKTYYPGGRLKSESNFKHGKQLGFSAIYNEDGRTLESMNHVNGKLNGSYFRLENDGRQIYVDYKDGRKEGVYTMRLSTGKGDETLLLAEGSYRNGKLQGIISEYHPQTQKLIAKVPFEKGRREGAAEYYTPQGALLLITRFVQDKQEGEAVEYYPSGKARRLSSFKDGVLDGVVTSYFESGKVESTTNYFAGKLHGLSKTFNESGTIIFEGEYKDGMKHGVFNKYTDDGAPKLLQTYENDTLVSKKNL